MQSMSSIPMTRAGYIQLQKRLNHLKEVSRPQVIQSISEARKHGDLSENEEYQSAKEAQHNIENEIRTLEMKVRQADVVDVSSLSGTKKIVFGATVTLLDTERGTRSVYQIVGVDEADPKQNKLAIHAALVRELIRKEEGDTVEFSSSSGDRTYLIEKVDYINA